MNFQVHGMEKDEGGTRHRTSAMVGTGGLALYNDKHREIIDRQQ